MGAQAATRGGSFDYSAEEFRRHYKLACLDYARVVFAYQLKDRDLAWVRGGAHVLGRCVHNRSVSHLMGLVRFLDSLLEEWELSGDLSGTIGTMPDFAQV